MRLAFKLEPIYRVTVLTRKDWTKEPALLLHSKGSFGLQIGPRLGEGGEDWIVWAICGKKTQYSLCKYATDFNLRYLLS